MNAQPTYAIPTQSAPILMDHIHAIVTQAMQETGKAVQVLLSYILKWW